MILDNIEKVREKINDACRRSGRNPADVTLVAVSKTKPISDIEEALPSGIIDFGENKVQELATKYESMDKNIRWHMIGHLQRNKVKYLVGKTVLIHSVDSLRLAEQIEKDYSKEGQIADILIEVNLSDEESKYGLKASDTESVIREISHLKHVKIKGLMTVAPATDDPESNRIYFKKLKDLSVDIADKCIDNVSMSELSMGMTGDYEIAVEEGATLIRVGTAIFGKRDYMV